jgi:ABC-type branched-subunit amino acid transport system substrate-binding protein
VFIPSTQAAAFAKQFVERGLDKAGITLIGPGDLTDDEALQNMGDAMLGTVTAHFYSAAHASALNKAFTEAYKQEAKARANFMAVSGYDGMHLIYEALKKTRGLGRRQDAGRRDEGHELGEPARSDVDRSRQRRCRAQHLHPQGRECRWRIAQYRVRDLRQRP